jgi:hypothetical protein
VSDDGSSSQSKPREIYEIQKFDKFRIHIESANHTRSVNTLAYPYCLFFDGSPSDSKGHLSLLVLHEGVSSFILKQGTSKAKQIQADIYVWLLYEYDVSGH